VHADLKEFDNAQLDRNRKGKLCYIMEGSSTK